MRHFAPASSLIFVSLFTLSTLASASAPIDQTRALDARGRIDVENIKDASRCVAGTGRR